MRQTRTLSVGRGSKGLLLIVLVALCFMLLAPLVSANMDPRGTPPDPVVRDRPDLKSDPWDEIDKPAPNKLSNNSLLYQGVIGTYLVWEDVLQLLSGSGLLMAQPAASGTDNNEGRYGCEKRE